MAPPRTMVIDTRPLLRAVDDDVRRGVLPAVVAHRFHSTMVDVIAATCMRIAERTGIRTIVLSGGVFANALLTTETTWRLDADGFRVFRHQKVPTNDGGLSLGQVAIAASVLQGEAGESPAIVACEANSHATENGRRKTATTVP